MVVVDGRKLMGFGAEESKGNWNARQRALKATAKKMENVRTTLSLFTTPPPHDHTIRTWTRFVLTAINVSAHCYGIIQARAILAATPSAATGAFAVPKVENSLLV
jgi:hypothetical protein